jgi:PD-(D/E)XK nuclease superfamily protein
MTISVSRPSVPLTDVQARTVRDLISGGDVPLLPDGLAVELRDDLDRRLAEALSSREDGGNEGSERPRMWIGKRRLDERDRCEGLFLADLVGECPPFRHTATTASGSLYHKAIEVDLATERRFDPRSVCDHAVHRLVDGEPSFGAYWRSIDPLARSDVLAEAGRRLALFRDTFPPFPRRWAAQPELRMRAELAGGRVVLSGTPDLVLGRRRRLLLDLKSGRARPGHPEELRFYALLALLRTGVAPYRIATVFLDSGTWQAEDVTPEVLHHAADRAAETVARGVALRRGASPRLSPGPQCARCPRREGCPALAAATSAAASG